METGNEVQAAPVPAQSEMMKQVKAARAEAAARAHSKRSEALPAGVAPVAEVAAVAEVAEVAAVAAVAEGAPVAEVAAAAKEEELIRIGDKEFTSAKEAFAYAEKLEQEKLVSDAYNMGIQETLRATRPPEPAPAAEDDNFDEKFYSDPKGTLREIKEQATKNALAAVKAEQAKEKMWNAFSYEYPDIDRADAERILAENIDTLGKMTDIDKAKKILATKTRAYYQGIVERMKPRTELPNKAGQVVSTGTSAAPGVTPAKKDEKPLTLVQQMKTMRRKA